MATTLALHPKGGRHVSTARPMVLAVLHPKGWRGPVDDRLAIGAELALRGKRVRIEDLDQGRHLSRVFERHPLGLRARAARAGHAAAAAAAPAARAACLGSARPHDAPQKLPARPPKRKKVARRR